MHFGKQEIALSLLLGMGCQTGWAQSAAGKALLEQGLYWQAQGNSDRASEAWRKLLRLQPDEPRALYGLAQVELSMKRGAAATEILTRLRALDPKGTYTTLLAQDITLSTGDGPKTLDKARLLHTAGETVKELEQYQAALGNNEPQGDIGLEFYRSMSQLPKSFQTARAGFERLAKASPGDPQIEMSLAYLLAKGEEPHWVTRVEGVQRLARVSLVPSVGSYATELLKASLGWLDGARPESLNLIDAYLKRFPDDAEVQALRAAGVKKKQDQARNGEASTVNPQVAAGLKALNQGESLVAEAEYLARLKTSPKDPDALGGLGLVRMQQNRWDESLALLLQATQQKNGNNWSKALLAARYQVLVEQSAARREADPALARSLLEQAIKLDPRQNGAVIALAALQLDAGESAAAEKNYRQLLARDSADTAALRGLIDVLASGARLDEAHGLVERLTPAQVTAIGANEMNRLRATLASGLAKAAQARGDVALARSTLEKAMSQDRANPWIRWDLAKLYTLQGRHSEARGLIDGLLASQPANPVALFASASLAAARGQWRTALATLDHIAPSARTADMAALQKRSWLQHQTALAVSMARQGRKPEALALLEQVEPMTRANRDLLGVLADAYVDAGAANRGLGLLRDGAARNTQPGPSDLLQYASLLLKTQQDVECAGVLNELSLKTLSPPDRARLNELVFFHTLRQVDLLRERGDLTTGREMLMPMLAQRPEDPLAIAVLARLTAAAGDKRRALEMAHQLADKYPDNVDIQFSAAQLAVQFKDAELATTTLKAALALAPDDADVLSRAARLYRAQGQSALAATLFERAIALQNAPAPGHTEILAAANAAVLSAANGSNASDPADLLAEQASAPWLQSTALRTPPTAPVDYFRQDPPQIRQALAQAPAAAGTPRVALAAAVRAGSATAPAPAAVELATGADPRRELAEIRQSRSPELQAGGSVRSRLGVPGSSQLDQLEVPVELRLPLGEGKVKLQLTQVALNSGSGSGTGTPLATTKASGVAASIGYTAEGIAIDAGQTPAGFIYQNFTGGIKVNGALVDDGSLTYRVNVSSRPVTDSLLSFAGARNSVNGKTSGGVMASGAKLELTKDLGGYGLVGASAWHELRGHEVASNARVEVGFGSYVDLQRSADSQLSSGVNVNAMTFQQNLNGFNFGQGGYFSPQRYAAVSVPLNWAKRAGAVSYLLQGALGYQKFRQDANTAGGSTTPALSASGVSYKLAANAQVQLAPQWLLDASVQTDNGASGSYRQWGAGLNLRYSFAPGSAALPLPVSPFAAPYGQ